MQSTRLLASFLAGSALVLALALPDSRGAGEPGMAGPDAREVALGLSSLFQDVSKQVGESVVSVEARRGGRREATGSGVIVHADGLVVTNYHVVAVGSEFRVGISGRLPVEARLRGVDPDTDLAVLELPRGRYRAAPFGTRDPAVGEWVLAFGNPRGLGTSVTFGIIGGRERSNLGVATFERFLQTDAAINPGNSGGPLVNLAGEVIGINTAKGTAKGDDNGLGFSIPVSMVRRVVDGVVNDGQVLRGWLGIVMRSVWPREAQRLGLERGRHVAVEEVLKGSPAETAGLRAGDVIVALDGLTLGSDRELLEGVADRKPGAEVALDVWRDGAMQSIRVELGTRPVGQVE